MKNFICECGNTLYFANATCLACNRPLGFIPETMTLSACDVQSDGTWIACTNGKQYSPCKNYQQYNVCNWLVDVNDEREFCRSCELTETIPDLSRQENIALWYKMELAKRRLLYTLQKLKLPIWRKTSDDFPLKFRFLEDVTEDEYGQELTVKSTVVTGHNNGVITLNLMEAEDSSRIMMREKMNERYRTLVGHFRHESGHYYWDRLIQNTDKLHAFRALFGDERTDYTQALKLYYNHGPLESWQQTWISAYASMHPWEDWAESWAHYLHIIDTLETAKDYGVELMESAIVDPLDGSEQRNTAITTSFDSIYQDWCRLTTVLNALNRSMGLDDAYPFIIPAQAVRKLTFIHDLLHNRL